MRFVSAAALVLTAVLTVAACSVTASSSPRTADGRLRVVASVNTWAAVARQLGGVYVQVTALLDDPQADPHLFQLDARAAATVAGARVVIENGLGYDPFMRQVVAATTARDRIVVRAAAVLRRASNDTNPHLWYDVPAVGTVAAAIASALERADPAHRADYAANLAAFQRSLAGVERAVARLRVTHGGVPIATTEPVADYVLDAAGLDVRSPVGFVRAVAEGNEPSPRDTASMNDLLARRAIAALVYNAQTTTPTTDRVRATARADAIPVVAMTELIPRGIPSYDVWMLGEITALQEALDGTR